MSRNPRSSAARNKRRELLENLKKAKEGGISRTELLELDEDDDVFELLDEEEYQKLVEKRRESSDFVVDDENLGYYDDGEEHVGIVDNSTDVKKRSIESITDSKTFKKAKRLGGTGNILDGHEKSSTQTMLNFIRPGLSTKNTLPSTNIEVPDTLDLDDLVNNIGKSVSSHSTSNSTSNSSSSKLSNIHYNRQINSIKNRSQNTIRHVSQNNDFDNEHSYDNGNIDFGDNGDRDEDDNNNNDNNNNEINKNNYNYDNNNNNNNNNNQSSSKDDKKIDSNISTSLQNNVNEDDSHQKVSLSSTTKKFKTPKINDQNSTTSTNTNTNSTTSKGDLLSNVVDHFQEFSGSNEPNPLLNTIPTSLTSGISSSNNIDPAWYLQKDSATGEDYLQMFWLDATEVSGIIYLFGRVIVSEPGTNKRYVSCCVAVHGCERNLFILPRKKEGQRSDGSDIRAPMSEVYEDIRKILVPNIIPRGEGQGFRCKSVKRKYAFEMSEIPRDETEYMKVVYSSRHGVPSLEQCSPSLKSKSSIEHIFGASINILEWFLLKRKLMGPSWIMIKHPKILPDSVSWCKIEIGIDNPKFITKLSLNETLPSPPLTIMSVSMKTAINPVTHTHEIISISSIIHSKVDCDSDTNITTTSNYIKRFSYIRQLGNSCGPSYPHSFPHDLSNEISKTGGVITSFLNERSLLNAFFTHIHMDDPDILVSHNLFGFEFDVLLSRAIACKLSTWNKVGRLRRAKIPKSINDRDIASGRLLCDTYKASKEFLRETTYSLTNLALTQLKLSREDVDPIDVPRYFSDSKNILKLALHTMNDAFIVFQLLLKLQVIPLTKQLTNLSGNLWTRTMRGARAERIEYLLLHEFHSLKYILPERKSNDFNKKSSNKKDDFNNDFNDNDDNDIDYNNSNSNNSNNNKVGQKVGGHARIKAKAAYAGGLVLEPKKGLYDTFILLLDFNSLYPSLIQEYNLCFTTINWTKYNHNNKDNNKDTNNNNNQLSSSTIITNKNKGKVSNNQNNQNNEDDNNNDDDHDIDNEDDIDNDNDNDENNNKLDVELDSSIIPPIPDSNLNQGVLPRVIKRLVDRRKEVKSLLKKAKEPALKQQLDIRQKALKLTANSMYGCLGFTFSRFYARPIAALVTSKGREALQRTVDQAKNQMGLDVIYGDTDSVMINTGLTSLNEVYIIGNALKTEVNNLYRCLELDIDGIFKSILLLKKKKYAALKILEQLPDGTLLTERETKGLDLVRRDWCLLSKEAGQFTVEKILSGESREDIVFQIHEYLNKLSTSIRAGEIDLTKFVITKGLNKSPKDYPDVKGQPHLQVALKMLKANKPVNIGDHIPYVICKAEVGQEKSSPADRAHHPEDILRSNGTLTIDYEWYLSQQILPPISRLCEPIEGTSQVILSQLLGLDSSRYITRSGDDIDDGWGFTPKSIMDDAERFKKCKSLEFHCLSCNQKCLFSGVFNTNGGSGLCCSSCHSQYWGRRKASDMYCYITNLITQVMRDCIQRYYDCWLICDDHTCNRRTKQLSVGTGLSCLEKHCHGKMIQEYDEISLYNQLKYFETLFDIQRSITKRGLTECPPELFGDHRHIFECLKKHISSNINTSAYNWVRPSLWSNLFPTAFSSSSS